MAASSTPTASIPSAPPLKTADPVLTGTPQRGSVLTATAGTWSGLANAYTFRWQRSADGTTWTSIPGGTGLSYTLQVADENDEVRLLVTATNVDGTANARHAVERHRRRRPASQDHGSDHRR